MLFRSLSCIKSVDTPSMELISKIIYNLSTLNIKVLSYPKISTNFSGGISFKFTDTLIEFNENSSVEITTFEPHKFTVECINTDSPLGWDKVKSIITMSLATKKNQNEKDN